MRRFVLATLALILILSLCSGFPAAAASAPSALVDLASVSAWNDRIATYALSTVLEVVAQGGFWESTDSVFASAGVGSFDSSSAYFRAVNSLSTRYSSVSTAFERWFTAGFVSFFLGGNIVTKYDTSLGVYRPYNEGTNLWMVNSKGYFPYYEVEEAVAGETKPTVGGKWVRTDLITSPELNILSRSAVDLMADTLNQTAIAPFKCSVLPYKDDFLAIYGPEDDYRDYREIYCDSSGRPYVAQAKPDNAAVNQPNNYYTEANQNNQQNNTQNNQTNNNIVIDQGDTENNILIDVDNNTVWFPDGTFNYINQLLYDESTKTYSVDSHDSYTWNDTTNNYVTNNYNSFYQFHINYTSVTYIGTTAEYDKTYELYYQLPDGRSSADLTAEDLEQLSLAFVDVVNYKRSADDVSQRALYHFDGDTQDSSYWSYCTDFHWNSGASLTYMDEGIFGGSLYLDETAHDFTLTLPNNDASADFTLQFRYYQSYTAAPKTDSTLSLGGVTVFKWDGAKYYTGSGSVICATSIGTWNEICIMRKDSVLCYYINGVRYTGVSNGDFMGNTIRFQFGSQQQTYKKLDELRFTKGAIYNSGSNYSPSSVPYDTNLALVLPDNEIPIADEYFTLAPGENNLFDSVGLSDWTDSNVTSHIGKISIGTGSARWPKYSVSDSFNWYSGISFSRFDGFTRVSFVGPVSIYSPDRDGVSASYIRNILFYPLLKYNQSDFISYCSSLLPNTSYCLSVLLSDGSFSYIVFKFNGIDDSYVGHPNALTVSHVANSSRALLSTCEFTDYSSTGFGLYLCGLSLTSVDSLPLDIVYMELIKGDKPSFSLDWHSAVYSSGQLEQSPVLAVRSNLDVTTYQIGGVRPSYPSRGQVWALVENSRITSLQQYNGSAWVPVDGRIWTGERWIPYGSFDVFTLQDCYDIVDSSGNDYEYIYTESGFWAWWQKSWRTFSGKMDNWFALLLSALGVSDPGSGSGTGSGGSFWDRIFNAIADGLSSLIELLFDLIKIVLEQVLGLVKDLLSFFFDMLTDMVISGVGKFFSVFTDGSLFGFFQREQENEDGTVTTIVALPDDIAGVFGFFSAVILLLPNELRAILIFGVAAMLLLSVFKLVKS